jgi:hypothetical protein
MNARMPDKEVEQVIGDHSASDWLKTALRGALNRDPVDALNDALALAGILEERLRVELDLKGPPYDDRR